MHRNAKKLNEEWQIDDSKWKTITNKQEYFFETMIRKDIEKGKELDPDKIKKMADTNKDAMANILKRFIKEHNEEPSNDTLKIE